MKAKSAGKRSTKKAAKSKATEAEQAKPKRHWTHATVVKQVTKQWEQYLQVEAQKVLIAKRLHLSFDLPRSEVVRLVDQIRDIHKKQDTLRRTLEAQDRRRVTPVLAEVTGGILPIRGRDEEDDAD